MTHSIKIGKSIYSILSADTDVSAIVGTKIAPLVQENGTTFPFIVYTRESITPSTGTKDGYIGDLVIFRVDSVASSYNQAIDLADAIRHCLEKRQLKSAGLVLQDVYMSGITESFDSDTYITQMRFTCVVVDDPTPHENSSN